jgi:hypothetical protein
MAMKKKRTLRIIAACMLAAAIVFAAAALSNPGLGGVLFIGSLKITAHIQRIFYLCYMLAALCLFVVSFFVKD